MEHPILLKRVIDGDTVQVDIDLGFGIHLVDQHLRLDGIDTPEIHSSEPMEKHYGALARAALEGWLGARDSQQLRLVCGHNDRDKFGRLLGNIRDSETMETASEFLIKQHHAVPYHGQNKDEVRQAHLENRRRLQIKREADTESPTSSPSCV